MVYLGQVVLLKEKMMKIEITEIKKIIKSEVSPNVNIDAMSENDSWDEAGIDSLDRSSLFLAIEEAFDIEVSDEAIEEIDNIQDLINYIDSK